MPSKLRFFKAVLVEKTVDEVIKENFPPASDIKIEERIGKCPDCDSNSWLLLADEQVAVKEGGKQYCECLGCGLTSHI